MAYRAVTMAAALLAFLTAACAVRADEIRAATVAHPPTLDGVLDDACWQRPPDATEFWYLETGAAASEQTNVWICYDQHNIYVAFGCSDSRPHRISAQQKKRGGSIWTDDWVGVNIDPWHAHREVFWFDVTPRGTQVEHLPGAGGSKIEWLGDWRAAAKMDTAGWAAEMAIPWAILKYPKGQRTMGIAFIRRHARLDQWWFSPNMGPNVDYSLMLDWVGLQPPEPRLRTIALHYTNMGSSGVGFENGLDIKRQLSRETNALLTVNPDFKNIEQDLESIDFTYSPRVLLDNRAFFAEGSEHFDDETNMFYTRDIEEVDVGLKVVGQAARSEFAGVAVRGDDDTHLLCKQRWILNRYSHVGLAGSLTEEPGVRNNVGAFHFALGSGSERRTDRVEGRYLKSSTSGPGRDGSILVAGLWGEGGPRQLGYGLWYSDLRPTYFAADGIVPDPDLKGWFYHLRYGDEYDSGRLRGWQARAAMHSDHLHDGNLLSRGFSFFTTIWSLSSQVHVGFTRGSRRDETPEGSFAVFDDRTAFVGYAWNSNDMYRRGYVDASFGRRAGGRSLYAQIKQRLKLADGLHADLGVEYVRMTGPFARRDRQSIAALTYDISSERSVSVRVIERDATFNLAFGFRRAVRRGYDLYLLFGDPNADRTKGRVILKVIRPLF